MSCAAIAGAQPNLEFLRRVERVFLDWRALPADDRPDFLTYAHCRRRPAREGEH